MSQLCPQVVDYLEALEAPMIFHFTCISWLFNMTAVIAVCYMAIVLISALIVFVPSMLVKLTKW